MSTPSHSLRGRRAAVASSLGGRTLSLPNPPHWEGRSRCVPRPRVVGQLRVDCGFLSFRLPCSNLPFASAHRTDVCRTAQATPVGLKRDFQTSVAKENGNG